MCHIPKYFLCLVSYRLKQRGVRSTHIQRLWQWHMFMCWAGTCRECEGHGLTFLKGLFWWKYRKHTISKLTSRHSVRHCELHLGCPWPTGSGAYHISNDVLQRRRFYSWAWWPLNISPHFLSVYCLDNKSISPKMHSQITFRRVW